MSYQTLLTNLYRLFETLVESAVWIYQALTSPVSSLFSWFGITLPDFAIFNVTFGQLLLGSAGLFIVYSLLKWVADLVL